MTDNNKSNQLMIALIKENIGNETGHALIKLIYTEHKILKLFWAISLILSNSFCAYLIVQTLLEYLNFETYTSTKTIFETPFVFPKVTICNNNQFTTQSAVEFLENLNKEYYPTINIFNESQMGNLSSIEKFKIILNIYSIATSKMYEKNFTYDRKRQFGTKLYTLFFN